MISSNHNSIKDFYNKMWEKEESLEGQKVEAICRYNTILATIRRIKNNRKLKILDFGCGNGDLTNLLSKYGQITGIDLSDEAIKIAKKKYPHINFICSSVFDMTKQNKYDLIVSSEVIEHLTREEQGEYIQLIYNNLVDNGYLLITTPNKEVANALEIKGDQPIENWLTINETDELISANNLKTLKIYTTYFKPIRDKLNKYLWVYFYLIEPIFRPSKSGVYTVILAKKY